MDEIDIVLWGCFATTALLSLVFLIYFRKRVLGGFLSEHTAKFRYSWLCAGISVISGTVIFLGVMRLFGIPLGHGEEMIAAPILNLLLAIALIVAGRIVIGWSPMKW